MVEVRFETHVMDFASPEGARPFAWFTDTGHLPLAPHVELVRTPGGGYYVGFVSSSVRPHLESLRAVLALEGWACGPIKQTTVKREVLGPARGDRL